MAQENAVVLYRKKLLFFVIHEMGGFVSFPKLAVLSQIWWFCPAPIKVYGRDAQVL